jgi:hypothetical protein
VTLLIKLNLENKTIKRLEQLFGGTKYDFLGFTLDLKTNTIKDSLEGNFAGKVGEWKIMLLTTLLTHYTQAKPTPKANKLIKFKDIPGGHAYEGAFVERAICPVAEYFGEKPEDLPRAAKLLGGKNLSLGEVSAEIEGLKGIPLTYILWAADSEFSASANILYDESASSYLPTEDLGVLGELTTARLLEAKAKLPS